jgi:hypothetical protein
VRTRRRAIARRISALNGRGNGCARGIDEAIKRLGDDVYAYVGAIFECEGTIGVTRSGQLCVGVEMIDRRAPALFFRLFGGSVRHPPAARGRQPTWRWTAKTRIAESALWKLLPWLVTKRAQAQLALGSRVAIGRAGRLTAEQRRLRESTAAGIRRLKRSTIEEEDCAYVEGRNKRLGGTPSEELSANPCQVSR